MSSLLNPKGHTTLKVGQVISQTKIDPNLDHGDHTVIINHLYCHLSLADLDLDCLYTHQLQLLPPGRNLWKFFLVFRDNWLVISQKFNHYLGNNSMISLKATSHKIVSCKENNKLINDANTISFSRPYVVKSIPSWTITHIVPNAISKSQAREKHIPSFG